MSFYVKFSDFKYDSLRIAKLFWQCGYTERAASIEDCATNLVFGNRKDGSHDLIFGNFCKDRFCPLCQARRSARRAMELLHVIDRLDGEFVLLTLTVRNVDAAHLRSQIEFMQDQFHDFMKDPRIKKGVVGYIRNLEVTYNKDSHTYHPHYHVLINVSSRYFVDHSQYLSRSEVLSVWKAYMHDDTISQVDIRKVRGKQLDRAVVETTKYFTKFGDWVNEADASIILDTFVNSLKSVNCTTMGGSIRKEILQLRKEKKEDLVSFDEKIAQFIQNANSVYESISSFYFKRSSNLIFWGSYNLDLFDSKYILKYIESHSFFRRKFQSALYKFYEYQVAERFYS